MKILKYRFGAVLATIVFAAALLAVGFMGFKANGAEAPHTLKTPVELTGSWHQTPDDNLPVNMTAEITPNHIQIFMRYSNVVSGLYWDGTFETNQTKSSFKVVSTSDEQGLSQDQTKIFSYENGVISYDFAMLGKDYTVHLSRGE